MTIVKLLIRNYTNFPSGLELDKQEHLMTICVQKNIIITGRLRLQGHLQPVNHQRPQVNVLHIT